jgi:exopolysaccharide production protein ExoY
VSTCTAVAKRPGTRSPHEAHSQRALYAFDRSIAVALFPFSAAVMCVVALIIRLSSSQSPFVAHLRVGRFGEPFWMLKFRTMWKPGASCRASGLVEYINADGDVLKAADDSRVPTEFARLCRKYSLDELPQLLHVITGRMSLVGPRPITRSELVRHYGEYAAEVLQLRPGMSGLWQVKGRGRLTYQQRRRLDLFLVRNFSLRLYMRILLHTLPSVFLGRDAW